MELRKLWIALAVVVTVSFAILIGVGAHVMRSAPPVPSQVVTAAGRVVFDGRTIVEGQNVWQSIGGQEIGSIWGHGAYVAPDWTADWLHREAAFILDRWARQQGARSFDALDVERRAALIARLTELTRRNTYDPARGTITIDSIRADAFESNAAHYASVFGDGRPEYAIPRGALVDPARQRAMASISCSPRCSSSL